MATPPTFITDVESSFTSSTSPVTSPSFNGLLGDLVVGLLTEANFNTGETYAVSGSVETFTQGVQSTGTNDADGVADSGYTTLTADRTGMTVSAARTGGVAHLMGVNASVWRGGLGVGNVNASGVLGTNASWSFTTNFDNSAVVCIFVDWGAVDGASRTWRTVNGNTPTAGNGQELAYFRNTTDYAVYIAYYPDAGSAGAKTLGLTAPTGGVSRFVAAAVEVQGSAAAVPAALQQMWPPASEVGGPWPRPQLLPLPPTSTTQVSAEIGTDGEAAAMYATEMKVAVQGGVCGAAGAGIATEKKIQGQAGTSNAAAAATAVEKKVGAESGVSAAGGAATSVETSGTIASERGTLTAAGVAYATEKKVAVQGGSCAAAGAATSSVKKVAAPQGSAATAGGAATSVEKKVGKESGTNAAGPATTSLNGKKVTERGTIAAAATGTSIETSGQVASERGTGAAAAAAYATERKVAVQSGLCSAGATATSTSRKVATEAGTSSAAPATTGVCKKVGKATGACTAGASGYSVQAKRVTQSGRLCAAATATGLLVSPFRTMPSRVSTLERKHRAETGDARFRVSTLDRRFRVSTE